MKKILAYIYSGLSLLAGVWGIVSCLISINGQTASNNYFVYIALCVISILSPVAVFLYSEKREKDTLESIKERFIEDEEALPSTLSYLIDTIVNRTTKNNSLSVETIVEDITIHQSTDGIVSASTITRHFCGIKSRHRVREMVLRINHHIFVDLNDYNITVSYGQKNENGDYSYLKAYVPQVLAISKSTMEIRIPFKYYFERNQEFSVGLKVSCKKPDIYLKDTIETFPIDPSAMFSRWNSLSYRFHVQESSMVASRTLQVVAYKRPKLSKVLAKPDLYLDSIPESGNCEISIDNKTRKTRVFPKKSIIIAVMQKRK